MAEVIIMPKLGFNMDEGELVKWHRKEGESIKKGEVLFEINTDKTTMPVEATADGTVLKIVLAEGETADVFTPLSAIRARMRTQHWRQQAQRWMYRLRYRKKHLQKQQNRHRLRQQLPEHTITK